MKRNLDVNQARERFLVLAILIRTRSGGSIREFSSAVGISKDFLNTLKKGFQPSLEKMVQFANFAGLSMEQLGAILDGKETPDLLLDRVEQSLMKLQEMLVQCIAKQNESDLRARTDWLYELDSKTALTWDTLQAIVQGTRFPYDIIELEGLVAIVDPNEECFDISEWAKAAGFGRDTDSENGDLPYYN